MSRVAYLLVFLVVALRQPRATCLWHWVGAILASMAGSAIMASIPTARWLTPVEAFLIYLFYIASLALSWSGLRLFNGRSARWPTIAAMTIGPVGLYAAMILSGVPLRVSLTAVVAFCFLYAVLASREASRRTLGVQLWSRYVVAAAFAFYAVALLLTIGILVGTDLPMNSPQSAQISMVIDQATSILVYFGYIAMTGERAVVEVHRLAETEPLTGLQNRRGLETALLVERKRGTGGQSGGLLLADIDHFKSINDTFGHEAGDMILVGFAKRLRDVLREGDIAARWGGEEFLAVLPHTDIEHLGVVAERLRRMIEADPFVVGADAIRVTISIGISTMSPGVPGFELAMRRADAALYEAKASGRNQVRRGRAPAAMENSEGRAA